MASHHRQQSDGGHDEIVPLQFLSRPSDDMERTLDRDSAASDENLNTMKNVPDPKLPKGKSEFVRRHKTVLLFLALYLPLLIVPFPLTAIMVHHPLHLPSYLQYRSHYQAEDFDFNYRAQAAVRILNSIRAVATIPLIGTILAQVAAIHTQRTSVKSRKLSLSQTLALANRGWTEPWLIWQSLLRGSIILPLGALLILIFSITQPLEQLLVDTEIINVLLCEHNLDCSLDFSNLVEPVLQTVGNDASPQAVAQAPLYTIMREVSHDISWTSGETPNDYLWSGDWSIRSNPLTPESTVESSEWFSSDDTPFRSQPFYTSSLPMGTTTGLLRQHAMRLNSSIGCEYLTKADYPTTCPGARPFTNSWIGQEGELLAASIDICVPGNYSQTPWTQSRNRQDIREEMYMNVLLYTTETIPVFNVDPFTLHCVGMTTRGYFELGNDFNDQHAQDLLETWPTPEEMEENFLDYEEPEKSFPDHAHLLKEDDEYTTPLNIIGDLVGLPKEYLDLSNSSDYAYIAVPAAGPLMTSVISIFGNQTLFGALASHPPKAASDIICANPQIPFAYFDDTIDDLYYDPPCRSSDLNGSDFGLTGHFMRWISAWHDRLAVQKMLSFSMFQANRVTLNIASSYSEGLGSYSEYHDTRPPRPIYTSPGYKIQKPSADFSSIIILGVLYSLQVLILIAFAVYILRYPTWTRSLDAFSLVRVVASMDKESLTRLASFDGRSSKGLKAMDEMDGVIGAESWQDGTVEEGWPDSGDVRVVRRLTIGGSQALV